VKDLLTRCVERRDLLRTLVEGQDRYGYLPGELLDGIAQTLDLPVNEVYGVASFYSFLSLKPLGRNTLWICRCLPCDLNGGKALLESIRDVLGIVPGETTSNGDFTLQLTNCIGACDQAPAMMVNADRYGRVGPVALREILSRYR